jgi:ubiquitin-conjugating enzyme E2 Z
MSIKSAKRLLKDRMIYQESTLNEHGIYCIFDDSNIYHVKAMIVGPQDTPYDSGFYFFDIHFPMQYPLIPPKVKFMTLNSEVRFNPNLYKCGKVCLSIIGTWSGPSWTSAMNLNTVLVSIQSLLNEMPLQNEPGYENETGSPAIEYNKLIHYYNIKVAVIQMIKSPPIDFEDFTEYMNKDFMKNYPRYIDYFSKNASLHETKLKSKYAGMVTKFDMNKLKELIDEIKERLTLTAAATEVATEAEAEAVSAAVAEVAIEKKKYIRKCPKLPAKHFEANTIEKGLDGSDWKVITYGTNGDKKKWLKV